MKIKIGPTKEDNEYGGTFICPLRTDLGSCGLLRNSDINSCPHYNGRRYTVPKICPLRDGPITLELKK